jgi:hypothetical protein
MVGKHNIIVQVDDIKFDLTVERNITITIFYYLL